MLELLKYAFGFLQDCFKSRRALALENIALRTQLALYQEKQAKGIVPKPQCTPRFRMTWILLSRFFAEWKDALCVVKPETVMRWHKIGFKNFWRRKSRRNMDVPLSRLRVVGPSKRSKERNQLGVQRVFTISRRNLDSVLRRRTLSESICPKRREIRTRPCKLDIYQESYGRDLGC